MTRPIDRAGNQPPQLGMPVEPVQSGESLGFTGEIENAGLADQKRFTDRERRLLRTRPFQQEVIASYVEDLERLPAELEQHQELIRRQYEEIRNLTARRNELKAKKTTAEGRAAEKAHFSSPGFIEHKARQSKEDIEAEAKHLIEQAHYWAELKIVEASRAEARADLAERIAQAEEEKDLKSIVEGAADAREEAAERARGALKAAEEAAQAAESKVGRKVRELKAAEVATTRRVAAAKEEKDRLAKVQEEARNLAAELAVVQREIAEAEVANARLEARELAIRRAQEAATRPIILQEQEVRANVAEEFQASLAELAQAETISRAQAARAARGLWDTTTQLLRNAPWAVKTAAVVGAVACVYGLIIYANTEAKVMGTAPFIAPDPAPAIQGKSRTTASVSGRTVSSARPGGPSVTKQEDRVKADKKPTAIIDRPSIAERREKLIRNMRIVLEEGLKNKLSAYVDPTTSFEKFVAVAHENKSHDIENYVNMIQQFSSVEEDYEKHASDAKNYRKKAEIENNPDIMRVIKSVVEEVMNAPKLRGALDEYFRGQAVLQGEADHLQPAQDKTKIKPKVITGKPKSGAKLDELDARGYTLAHRAAEKGDIEGLKTLALRGADLNKPDSNGRTVVHIAAENGDDKLVKALHKISKDLEAQGKPGIDFNKFAGEVTAAYHAAEQGHHKVIEALHEAGADLNKPMPGGDTPAMIAAVNNRLEVIKALEKAGADLNRANDHGRTPILQVAIFGAHESMVEYLAGRVSFDGIMDDPVLDRFEAAREMLLKYKPKFPPAKHEVATSWFGRTFPSLARWTRPDKAEELPIAEPRQVDPQEKLATELPAQERAEELAFAPAEKALEIRMELYRRFEVYFLTMHYSYYYNLYETRNPGKGVKDFLPMIGEVMKHHMEKVVDDKDLAGVLKQITGDPQKLEERFDIIADSKGIRGFKIEEIKAAIHKGFNEIFLPAKNKKFLKLMNDAMESMGVPSEFANIEPVLTTSQNVQDPGVSPKGPKGKGAAPAPASQGRK